MLCKEIIAVYTGNHMKPESTKAYQTTELSVFSKGICTKKYNQANPLKPKLV
jgi:hypothetical protein